MKNILVLITLSLMLFTMLQAEIIPDLKENANVIIENYEVELAILNQEEVILKVKIDKLILNENGDNHGLFAEYYDQFRKIKSFEGEIYDANHKVIEKIKYRDLIDRSLINDFSLYEDNRIKYYKPQQKNYPYRVVYNYEIEYNGIFIFPLWQPLQSSNLSVKAASLKVVQSETNPVRYKLNQIKEPEIIKSGDQLIYTWEVQNLQARKREPLRLPYSLTSPTVYLAPNDFSIDGYQGNMSSWEEFGRWRNSLMKDQGALPEEAIQDIRNLIQAKQDKFEKAKLIYEYMQSRTRYISIQEGIGGWKPIDAETVHNLGYGDCKALTNYTKALLKVAGVESQYAVIKAGVNEFDIQCDFPSNQFNHAILCIPFDQDTVWLECTSQSAPFGYLGDFTGNKHALLISEKGGQLVRTTQYFKEQNLQKRHIVVDLNENGLAKALVQTNYGGLQYDNISYYIGKSRDDQKEFLLKKLEINDFTLEDFSLEKTTDIFPTASDSICISINNYANASNSRLFFSLNMLNKNDYVPVKLEERISPIRFTYAYSDIDSIEYNIPENYTIEYIPENYTIKNQFGEYTLEYSKTNKKVIFVRRLSMNKDVFSPESYNELVNFFEEISKHDKSKCVLKKAI